MGLRRLFKNAYIKHKYNKIVNETCDVDYFNCEKLVCYNFKPCRTPNPQNFFYGNDLAIANYDSTFVANRKGCVIEHGLYLGEAICPRDFSKEVKTVYTFSEYRENAIRSSGISGIESVNIKKVGPYICHTDNFYSPKLIENYKAQLGSVLLVFPSHSIEDIHIQVNHDQFIADIKSIAQNYKTVIICVYWKDILDGLHIKYQESGFTIATAGHRSDPRFLSRLKDLIEISDMTMSNNIGTHVGYCIAMNRPHYIKEQEIVYTGEGVEKEFKNRNSDHYKSIVNYEKRLLFDAFSSVKPKITPKQQELVDHFWGKVQ